MNPYKEMPKSAFWRSAVVENDALENLHLPKWTIEKSECIVTMGSCFAQHIGQNLKRLGFNVPYFDSELGVKVKAYGANYGNVYTVRQALQLLRECNGDFSREENYWEIEGGYIDPIRPNVFTKPFESKTALYENRQIHLRAVIRAITEMDVFIFTLGLTETWENSSCKSVLPVVPGVLGGIFSAERYNFRNFSYTETSHDLSALVDEIHKIRRGKKFKLLLTVSPVPLTATAEFRHVLISSAASKSILRAVADEFVRSFDFIDYFPSFEIITNPKHILENYKDNMREVKQSAVDKVMKKFHSAYVYKINNENKPFSRQNVMIDEIADVDCEDALLDQFKDYKENAETKKDILFFGNSHLGFMKNAFSKELFNKSVFAPSHFLANSPINDIEVDKFKKFKYKKQKFKNIEGHECKTLIIAGYSLCGDGILRALGIFKGAIKGCKASEILPQLSPNNINEGAVRKKFEAHLQVRFGHIQKIYEANLFEKFLCIVSPDLPEHAARFRLGDEFVESKLYFQYKEIYTDVFSTFVHKLNSTIQFIFHDNEDLYTEFGFTDPKYGSAKLWDIHPNHNFYVDSNLETKILDFIT